MYANSCNNTTRCSEQAHQDSPKDISAEHGNDIDDPYLNDRYKNQPCVRTVQCAAYLFVCVCFERTKLGILVSDTVIILDFSYRLPLLSDQKISKHRSREFPQDHRTMRTSVDQSDYDALKR